MPIGRRAIMSIAAGAALCPPAHAGQTGQENLAAFEARSGGRLGVDAVDTGSGRRIGHRSGERFPMCSTHKFLTVAAILARVDQGKNHLGQWIAYRRADLLSYAPVTAAHVDAGGMTLGALCAAAIDWSDNTAANLLLRLTGGPAGFTRYARSLGDPVTRLDRNEPALNFAPPGDERDTTSPAAMVHDLNEVLLGTALSSASRRRLEDWLLDNKTGTEQLRAGVPPTWQVGDKTGNGGNGSTNDIAILRPPGRAPILVAVYYTGSPRSFAARKHVIAEVGRIVARTFFK